MEADAPSTAGNANVRSTANQLHDLFSTADIEKALSSFNPLNVKEDNSFGIRLPFLLRCLGALQARSDVLPYLTQGAESQRPNVNSISRLLEDVAAAHQGAENVELLLAIAPSLCYDTIGKSIGKIPQLSRCKVPIQSRDLFESDLTERSSWDTRGLSAALDHYLSSYTDAKLKRGLGDEEMPGKKQKLDDYDSDDSIIPPAWTSLGKDDNSKAGQNSDAIHHASFAANDSYESAMKRTLEELISLVKSSLDSDGCGRNLDDGDKPVGNSNTLHKEASTPGISVKSESLFAETNPTSSSFGDGCSSLSVMVVTLMHHSPVLRHDHVATALCRAAVPQAHTLIQHMAANCPASVPCLLKGIINAYKLADQCSSLKPTTSNTDDMDLLGSGAQASDVVKASIKATRSIASLSQAEALNVTHMLRKYHVMDDLVLELLNDHDPVAGASFIVEKLSTGFIYGNDTSSTRRKSLRRQSSSSIDQHSRPIPLRQRILGNRGSIDNVVTPSHQKVQHRSCSQSKLINALKENKSLVEQCMQSVSSRVSKDTSICAGQVALFLRAFAILVHCTEVCNSKTIRHIVGRIPDLVMRDGKTGLPECSPVDDVNKLAICVITLVWLNVVKSENEMTDSDSTTTPETLWACLLRIMSSPSSLECVVFSSRLAGFAIGNDATSMVTMILHHVYSTKFSSDGTSDINQAAVSVINHMLSDREQLEQIHKSALTLNTTVYNPIVTIEALGRCEVLGYTDLDHLVKNLLSDQQSCRIILHNPMLCELVQESVKMLMRRPTPHLPLVLPVSLKYTLHLKPMRLMIPTPHSISIHHQFSLERKALSIQWSTCETSELQEVRSQFVIQLLYALLFLDEVLHRKTASPFVINPRAFPLKEVMCFVTKDSDDRGSDTKRTLLHMLENLVSRHCPDVLHQVNNEKPDSSDTSVIVFEDITPSALYQAIRDCLQDETKDPSGIRAEKMHMMCSSHCTTDALVTTVCGAVLAPKHSQRKVLNYTHLCKDPLVIFKAPVSAWKCHGVRTLMLKTLCHLMKANESIAIGSSKTSQVVTELLAARNSIIARCLLFAQTNLSLTHCTLSANMIRALIARCPGITAALLKHGLDDDGIVYLCRFVPESFSDASILTAILSNKETLSVPERLVLANASLRIAIAHCSRQETFAKGLASVSLSVLIESFQYVIGPVGVPVRWVGLWSNSLDHHCNIILTRWVCCSQRFKESRWSRYHRSLQKYIVQND